MINPNSFHPMAPKPGPAHRGQPAPVETVYLDSKQEARERGEFTLDFGRAARMKTHLPPYINPELTATPHRK